MTISNNILFTIVLLTALGSGLAAGLFFIFSNTVMRALGRIEPAAAIAAMNSMNEVILNPTFFLVFMGTAVASLFLLIASLLGWHNHSTLYLILGSAIYLLGCMLVTIVFNVPMNNALAAIEPADPSSLSVWSDYLVRWTFWNHVRTVATIASTALFMLALCR